MKYRANFSKPRWLLGAVCASMTLPNGLGYADEVIRAGTPETPNVQAASRDAIDQIGTFRMPDEIECKLFAAEPDVSNPVVFGIDNQGRIYTCESFRQSDGVTDNRAHDDTWLHADLAAETVADRIEYHQRLLGSEAESYTRKDDRIRRLVDKDGDGAVDESVVFAEHFNNIEDGSGAGVLVRGNTAYFTCIPHLWKLEDEDGDGVSDHRTSLAYGFGVRVAFRGHDMHGLMIGPDGRLYFSIGDRGYYIQTPNGVLSNPESGAVFRCELDGSNLEVIATGLRNPQELAFDNYGNLFTGDNNSDSGDKARWVYVVPGSDSGWRMTYQYLPDRGPFNREEIWHPYKETTPGYVVPPIANISDGPSGLTFDPGTGLTDEFRDAFLLVDFRGQASNSGIRLIKNEADGAFFKIKEDGQPFWNILATDADYGTDGSLYVSDWVNGWTGEGKGRLYRFFNEDQMASDIAQDVKETLASDFNAKSNDELIGLLSHIDRRIRNEAQWQLATNSATSELIKLASAKDQNAMARLHAVWGLWQIARAEHYPTDIKNLLISLLGDDDAQIEVAALNALSDSRDTNLGPQINVAMASNNPRVAATAAIAAGRLQLADSLEVAVKMIAANGKKDPIVRHAGIMTLAGQADMNQVVNLIDHASADVRLAAVVALRKRVDSRLVYFLSDTAEEVALEAARAVNDVEILRRHMVRLAAVELKPNANPALARRVLNANYRLGISEAAQKIATIAASSDQRDVVRLEALDMLAKWSTPGDLDWVTNRFDPLPPRDATVAKEALQSQLDALIASEGEITKSTLRIASDYGFQSVEELFRKMLAETSGEAEQRIVALTGLLKLKVADSQTLLDDALADSDPVLRSAALKELVDRDASSAVDAVEKATASESIIERQTAWDAVPKLPTDKTEQLLAAALKAYLDNTLPKELRLNVYQAANRSKSSAIKDVVAKIDEARAGLDKSNPLVFYADSELGGDPLKGRKLFFERSQLSCVRCHKIAGTGGEVGPELTKIANERNAEYLLEAIVAPNAKIPDNFKTMIVQTEDGKVFSGVVRTNNDDYLELMNAEGKIVRVEQDVIVGQKEGLSSMPADLMKSMNARELRDLVAFLRSLDGTVTAEGFVQGHAEE